MSLAGRTRRLHAAAAAHRQPLRILALPLARSPTDPHGRSPLIYWHVSQRYARSKETTAAEGEAAALSWREPATWVPYAIEKASSTWLAWGEKPEGGKAGWAERVKGAKYWVWRRGEGLMDRIEADEWALKSINVALPAVPANADPAYRIPLIYPSSHPSIPDASVLPSQLRAHLASRIPHHRRLLIRSLILLPFTIPVAALPIIPNLPGFYVAFRAYSHWKALQGARWLSAAVGEDDGAGAGAGAVEVVPSDALAGCLVVPASQGSPSPTPVREQSSNTAPDSTATPASYPTGTPLTVKFSGETVAEKTIEMTNLTHGAGGAQNKADDDDDRLKHDSRDVSHDTTSTPSCRVHPSQSQRRDPVPASSEHSDATAAAAAAATAQQQQQQKVTSATPLFVPSTPSSQNHDAVDSNIYLPTAAVPRLVKAFDLAPHEVVDVTRAVMQARIRWVKALKKDGAGGHVADKRE